MKPVYMYDMNKQLIKEFKTTSDCALYFGKDTEYINHNLKYCNKIRKDKTWYKLSRKGNK